MTNTYTDKQNKAQKAERFCHRKPALTMSNNQQHDILTFTTSIGLTMPTSKTLTQDCRYQADENAQKNPVTLTLTLTFNRALEVVKVHVCAKPHQAECSGS